MIDFKNKKTCAAPKREIGNGLVVMFKRGNSGHGQ
jgi:hypothetical protein